MMKEIEVRVPLPENVHKAVKGSAKNEGRTLVRQIVQILKESPKIKPLIK